MICIAERDLVETGDNALSQSSERSWCANAGVKDNAHAVDSDNIAADPADHDRLCAVECATSLCTMTIEGIFFKGFNGIQK